MMKQMIVVLKVVAAVAVGVASFIVFSICCRENNVISASYPLFFLVLLMITVVVTSLHIF